MMCGCNYSSNVRVEAFKGENSVEECCPKTKTGEKIICLSISGYKLIASVLLLSQGTRYTVRLSEHITCFPSIQFNFFVPAAPKHIQR